MVGGLIPLAKQDITFGDKEYSGEDATPKPVSGGTNGGRDWQAIPCKGGCAHIELMTRIYRRSRALGPVGTG